MLAAKPSVLVAALLLFGCVVGAQPPDRGEGETWDLTVRIYDRVGLRPAWLPRAQAAARHVFDEIGVRTTWVECTPGQDETSACAQAPTPTDAFVLIVPRPTRAHARMSGMMGLAVLPEHGPGSHVYVFHDRVQALAAEYRQVDGSVILGHVIAHEIGHLLLGTNSHSRTGIMSARWFRGELRRLEKGGLLFAVPEPMRIRAELTERMTR
jgi:hypothetical protein